MRVQMTNPLKVISRLNTIKNEYIYEGLRKSFKNFGRRVARNAINFITFPVLVSCIFITGFHRMQTVTDLETMLVSPDSQETLNRKYIEKTFPVDSSNGFEPGRRTTEGRFGVVIIAARDGGSVLRHSVFDDIKLLDWKIRQLEVDWDNRHWRYEDICARNQRQCYNNSVQYLDKYLEKESNLISKYHIHQTEDVKKSLLALGGNIRNEQNEVLSAKTVLLNYFLDTNSNSKEILSSLWEEAFINLTEKIKFQNIIVESSVSTSFSKELGNGPLLSIPYSPVSVILLVTFTIITSSSPDWLRSKPWTGVLTAIASGMAIVSGIGLTLFFAVPFVSTNIIVPFLVLGIGMDDTFVMLSSWKRTDPEHSIEERMAEAYSEAGVSITLTSVTNIISFAVGWMLACNLGMKAFCISMAACLIFDYIYQITFVGAGLVLFAYAEKKNLHSLLFIQLKEHSETDGKKLSSKWLCPINLTNQKDTRSIIDDFWKSLAEILTWNISKILVVCFYLAYLSAAIWGSTKITATDTYKSLLIKNSSMDRFIDISFTNYYENRERIQFIINTTLNYADPQVQTNIENMMQSFEADEFLSGSELTESWLRTYLKVINNSTINAFVSNYNMTEESTFINVLRHFLEHPKAQRFKGDVVFNENYTQIIASRFLCQTNITRNYKDFRIQANRFQKVVSTAPYPVIMFHPKFPLFDGLNTLIPSSVRAIGVTVLVVTVVSWIFLPDMIGILCVTYSIFSIGLCIIGYMYLWNITISLVTLTVLIIASGLSVDYAAHLSCAYISRKNATPNERLREAVILVGMPIFQGAVSTVFALVIFSVLPSTAYVHVIKLLALICFTGALHGIIILPVIMCLMESLISTIKCKTSSKTSVSSTGKANEAVNVSKVDLHL